MKLVRMVTEGEYSDYGIIGLVLVDIQEEGDKWVKQKIKEFRKIHIPDYCQWKKDFPDEDCFSATHCFWKWLLSLPGVDEVRFEEWHVGSYGALNTGEIDSD